MPVLIDKLLSVLVFPLGTSFIALALAGALAWRGRPCLARAIALLGSAWLWVCSMPLTAGFLLASLEAPFPPVPAEDVPNADLIVVLGGGMAPAPAPNRNPDLGKASDRYWHAARLYHAGRAPLILVSGGNVWATDRQSEAGAARIFLEHLGVPAAAIIEEGESRNTVGNARYTARMLEDRKLTAVLLVTSAAHMGRALPTFERAGVAAIPAATDHHIASAAPWALELLPQAGALADTTAALKEYLGRLVYALRGQI